MDAKTREVIDALIIRLKAGEDVAHLVVEAFAKRQIDRRVTHTLIKGWEVINL